MKTAISFLKNRRVFTSAISWLIVLVTLILSKAGISLSQLIPLYLIGIVVGGNFFAREALEKLVEKRKVGVELLMSVGIIGAAILGEWFEALLLVGLYSTSEAIEGFTVEKTRNAIRALMDLVPKKALVKRDGKEELIPAETLAVGDIFIVKPGSSLATDGTIRKGNASVNQAPVTGESIPVFKKMGDQVFAGTINEDGLIEVEVTKAFKENTISKIIHLVEEAREQKGQRQQMVEKFAYAFSPIVLAISVAMPFVLPLFGFSFSDAFIRAVTFVVAASPCAFAISIPVAYAAALGTSARNGVLIKGGIYLEELANTSIAAFDKTGTLTVGHPKVMNVVSLNSLSHDKLLNIAGSLAVNANHPLDKAVYEQMQEEDIKPAQVTEFQSITGAGIKGTLDGQTFYLGSPELFKKMGHAVENINEFKQFSSEGKTVIFVGTKDKLYGALAIADAPRTEAKEVLQELNGYGIQTVMLTGDHRLVGESIGREMGVDTIFAELKPDDKVEKMKELKKKYQHVMMVGDGINDAPALAESCVGMAMGTIGTDAALEAADVALMGDDLTRIPYAVRLARFTKHIVFQNLVFATILQLVAMTLAVFMLLSVSQILFIDEFGEVLVVLNGLRLLKRKDKKEKIL